MGKLTERYVQDAALEFLKDYYIKKYNVENVFYDKEVVVNFNKKRGRADGLIAFSHNSRIFTVSMEAKSHKTYSSLIPDYEMNFWYKIIGLVYIVSAVMLYILLKSFNKIWMIPVVIIVPAIFAFGIYVFLFAIGVAYKQGIIEQVRRYPAHEQWLALSIDTYNAATHDDLFARAAHYGIGIVIVSRKHKCRIELEPKLLNKKKNKEYLFYYARAKKIEKELQV